MARLTPELLQRYHDGELSERATRRVEAQLAASADDQQALVRLERLGEMLRVMSEEQLAEVSFDGFEQRVALGIEQQTRPSAWERFKVWTGEFFEHRRVIWVPSAAVATAAVAVLLILPLGPSGPQPLGQPSGGGGEIWTASTGAAPAIARGSEIVSVRGAVGVPYQVENEHGELTGVAWITE
jgi:anti-sigma factor RsiW